jgi:hypothetical protein
MSSSFSPDIGMGSTLDYLHLRPAACEHAMLVTGTFDNILSAFPAFGNYPQLDPAFRAVKYLALLQIVT